MIQKRYTHQNWQKYFQDIFIISYKKTFLVILKVEWSQLKLGKTLKKSKILLMSTKFFAFFNKIFALFVPLIKVTFFPSLSYFTFVFKILRPYMPDLCILEKSGLQGFWSVKFTQRRKIKIGLHHFLETRDICLFTVVGPKRHL